MKSLSHQLQGHLCFLFLFQTDFDSFHVAFTSTISLLFLIEFFCHFSNVEKQTLKEKNKIKKKMFLFNNTRKSFCLIFCLVYFYFLKDFLKNI